jgi:hypothetical protein
MAHRARPLMTKSAARPVIVSRSSPLVERIDYGANTVMLA